MMNIGIGGSQGRMGQAIWAAIAADGAMDQHCVLKINRSHALSEGLKTQTIDVLIDFTVPEAAMDHIQICVAQQIPLVLGVTGFSDHQKKCISQAANTIPIVFSPNMSIGVNTMFSLLGSAAKRVQSLRERGIVVDSAIQETHHKHKKDAPSGTALRMGEIVGADHYASIRVGDVPGEHTVMFALAGECIEIKHSAQHRGIFAQGALTAAKWIINGPKPGLYDMQDVLGLSLKKDVFE
jgi:4-hydroxy-tetrahydrodipicolinate reductase